MRKLKVYGWQGHRYECEPAPNGSKQTREICAASSMAEIARLAGEKYVHNLFNLCETRNEKEIIIAMARPHTIFWKPINQASDYWREAK